MLDTTVFNRLVEGVIDLTALPSDAPMFCTYVQRQELERCEEPKRTLLIKTFAEIDPTLVPTDSGIWDEAPWDECGWGDSKDTWERILGALDARKKRENNKQDALIGETALSKGWIVITDDRIFCEVLVNSFGGFAILLRDITRTSG